MRIIPEYYEQEGEETYAAFHMGLNENIGENHKLFFRHIPLKSGRLLDVGCGDGVFLKEAEKLGYEVWGIDFDRKSIELCQKKRGLKNTFAMSPQQFVKYCERENLKFDIITFLEVLEHQDKPREFLSAVRSMLNPNGWIAGSVPNRDSWLLKKVVRKIYPMSDFPPNHFLRFSMTSLEKLLKSLSYSVDKISATPVKLQTIEIYLQSLLAKSAIKHIRKALTGSEYIGEKTASLKALPLYRRYIFKSIKYLRRITFLPFTLQFKLFAKGTAIYFQCRLSSSGFFITGKSKF